ncbi:MAG: hypothetical protein U5L00_07280 [Desulfovermiculus sp.]|nr:hypothetical protein [Desulfovermiculus sp.]
MASDILDPFTRIQPGPFIAKYDDWIIFTILLFFFWSVAGIALRKRFGESRHLRVLVTTVALFLAVGTYYSIYRGWLHLSLQGLGLLGAFLLLIVVFFILFGLMRGYGIHTQTALPLGFALFYTSMWAVSPNIVNTIIDIHPLLNLILVILFIASVFKVLGAFFRHTKSTPQASARDLQTQFSDPNDMEIKREIRDDQKERKKLKKTRKVTKRELKTVEEIERLLADMAQTIRAKGNSVDQEEIRQLTTDLNAISKNEGLLSQGSELLKHHVQAYQTHHRKDINELQNRLAKTPSEKKKKAIKDEILYQKTMLKSLDFMNQYEAKLKEFVQVFNSLLSKAMQCLKSRYPADALSHLEHAMKDLAQMKTLIARQKGFEKYLQKLDKKLIKDLKAERS